MELLPAATEAESPFLGGNANSPSEAQPAPAGSEPDNFERVAAAVPPVIGDDSNPQGGPEVLPAETAPPSPVNITPEAVGHWIDVPFNMLSAALSNDTLKLEAYEKEMLSPASRCGGTSGRS